VDVVAVASRRREHAEAYAREHDIGRAFGSYQDLLDDGDVEVVYISVPNSLHAEWSVRALHAGKHVLCEKPLTRRTEDARRMFNVAEEADRILTEGLMYRHHPQTRRIEQLTADGAIGRVQFIRAALSLELRGADIRLSADLDGGALMDLGCYCVSSLRLIGGEAESVFGAQVVGAGGVDVRFFGTLRFPNEVIGQFDVALTMPRRDQFEIVGSGGSILVADPWVCADPGIA
jgi:predicted dehydrogenase